MYLFVFIFLMLSTMGLFTEFFLMQSARLWANQKAAAEIMMTWHSGATSLAKELSADLGALPCRVSPNALPSGSVLCQRYLQNPSSAIVLPYTRHYLPVGYRYTLAQMQLPSIVYESGGARYLATYVPKETVVGDSAWSGFTASELLQQMRNAKIPDISYGQVIDGNCNGVYGHWFSTALYQNTTQICYPALATIPAGSVGMISVL